MRTLLSSLSVVIAVVSCGCYSNPNYQREIAVLRGEIIDLENRYFSIKSRYESAMLELEDYRGRRDRALGQQPEEIIGRPGDQENLPQIEDHDQLDPMIDDGSPDVSDGFLTASNRKKEGVAADNNDQSPQEWIRELRIDRSLTRAQDYDGKPGDDGILLVIQPLDAEGNVIPVAGDLEVSVIDERERGARQRIGMYQFQREDVEPLVETSEALGAGLHLRLEWNRHPPRNQQVRVFVRYTTQDGKRLETDTMVHVNTTRAQLDQWTQRPTPQAVTPAKPASSSQRPQWRPRR